MSTGSKVIVSAALTGAVTPKSFSEHLPITPAEIAEDAYRCWKAGAAVVHLHMRDDEGMGTMDAARFAETIKLIRARRDCDVIINCTTSGDTKSNDETRMKPIATLDGIEMCSYDAGSFNWMPSAVFVNSPQFLEKLGEVATARGVKPEIEIFDAGMLGIADYFVKQGKLVRPLHYQICLGILGGMPATVENSALSAIQAACRLDLVGLRHRQRPFADSLCDPCARRPCARRPGRQRVFQSWREGHQCPVGRASRSSHQGFRQGIGFCGRGEGDFDH